MPKNTGPRVQSARAKKHRRNGVCHVGSFSGIKPYTSKCRTEAAPGQHGQRRGGKPSDFAIQLRKKQEIKQAFNMQEGPFRRLYERASRMKGPTGDNLLQLLHLRLDSVVFEMGFAATRAEARQLVSHKLILVNGFVVNIPSFSLKAGDVVSVREKAKSQNRIHAALELLDSRESVSWVTVDKSALSGSVNALPDLSEMPEGLLSVNLVIEFYSK